MEWWQILLAVLGGCVTIFGGVAGLKWKQAMTLLREASEAVVALGMTGIRLEKALEDKDISDDEKAQTIADARNVVVQFWEAIAAARALFSKTH